MAHGWPARRENQGDAFVQRARTERGLSLALTLTLAQYGFLAVSIIALALLLAAGKTPERVAAATLTCLMFVSPYLTREGPVWTAVASGMTLAILVVLALRYERWWLIGAAGFQLVIFSTHFAPL